MVGIGDTDIQLNVDSSTTYCQYYPVDSSLIMMQARK